MILKVYDYIINYCEVVGFLSHYYRNYIDDDYNNDIDVDLLYDDYVCCITFGS